MSNLAHDATFLAPTRLAATALPIPRVLVIGRCLMAPLVDLIPSFTPGTQCDFILFNHLAVLDEPPHPVGNYTFQIIALPMRVILPEFFYLALPYANTDGARSLYEETCHRIDLYLDAAAAWNVRHGLETYALNFMLPQTNSDGRLLPRYDLRNMSYMFQKLNEHLETRVATYRNMHLVDIDSVAASMGRRHVQDDALWITSHSSVLVDHDPHYDGERLEPPPRRPSEIFDLETTGFFREAWFEIVAMHRTLRGTDPVKLVIVDLDDTLWRGVAAEREEFDPHEIEGWPLGLVEALMSLKRRGVLLAIASKNEEVHVARAFEALYRHRIHLDDFAIRKIGWAPKAETIAEILDEARLLAKNVVFIDDNPVERAAVAAAFPDMRILGDDLYALRRDLLWSAETQVAAITAESERRTEMVQAQVAREDARRNMTREAFLGSLAVEVALFDVTPDDAHFARAFELLNKTNQFNTSGRRWADAELRAAMAGALEVVAFTVADRYTRYGLVGVVLIEADTLTQVVMSCRVIGLDVESAVLAALQRRVARRGFRSIVGRLVETAHNHACRALYSGCGFTPEDGVWTHATAPAIAVPPHVTMIEAETLAAAA